jgi:hypothetical protein
LAKPGSNMDGDDAMKQFIRTGLTVSWIYLQLSSCLTSRD